MGCCNELRLGCSRGHLTSSFLHKLGVRVPGAFSQGLISNLSNPKMAVFFISVLPQFTAEAFGTVLIHGVAFATMTLTWLFTYAIVVEHARHVLGGGPVRRGVDAIAGVVLVAFGLRLAFVSP
jgi:threonine/homoserine/homoserine lactone efflux protein